MEIICDKCQSKLKVSDDKIPEGKTFSLKCPKCKHKISVNPKEKEEDSFGFDIGEENTDDEQTSVPDDDFGFGLSDDYDHPDRTFAFIEDEGKLALVCEFDKGVKEKIKPVLDFMEYHIIEADNARDAIKKMRYNLFDIIIINEEFDARDPDANGVLIYLARLQMLERRKMFVTMLSQRFKTLDHMMALVKSVNMIINMKNLDDIEKILKHGISDHDMFYRMYNENLKEIGRL